MLSSAEAAYLVQAHIIPQPIALIALCVFVYLSVCLLSICIAVSVVPTLTSGHQLKLVVGEYINAAKNGEAIIATKSSLNLLGSIYSKVSGRADQERSDIPDHPSLPARGWPPRLLKTSSSHIPACIEGGGILNLDLFGLVRTQEHVA